MDMFGAEVNARTSGDYSILKHLHENYCEAGSLVKVELFRRGLRFDESMRLGFEDWDFWLQAIGLGYVGRHVESMGLRYRKRPERSEEHTSEPPVTNAHLVCRLLLEKKTHTLSTLST